MTVAFRGGNRPGTISVDKKFQIGSTAVSIPLVGSHKHLQQGLNNNNNKKKRRENGSYRRPPAGGRLMELLARTEPAPRTGGGGATTPSGVNNPPMHGPTGTGRGIGPMPIQRSLSRKKNSTPIINKTRFVSGSTFFPFN